MKKLKIFEGSTMNTILVFVNGDLLKQIPYKTKQLAEKNYNHFIKHGMADADGNKIENAKFELL